MKFAMPSDDGAIKLAHAALTDHPYKELFALRTEKMHIPLWAGSISVSIFLSEATGRMVLFDVEMSCTVCPSYDSNLCT